MADADYLDTSVTIVRYRETLTGREFPAVDGDECSLGGGIRSLTRVPAIFPRPSVPACVMMTRRDESRTGTPTKTVPTMSRRADI